MCPMPLIMRRERKTQPGMSGTLPSASQSVCIGRAERREPALGRHVVELEARVARVHVEVDAEGAPRVEHALASSSAEMLAL